MPLPRARLDLLLVPADPERVPDEVALAGVLEQSGVSSWRIDRPGRVAFYANGLGGFAVRCPACGASVVAPFRKALEAWRIGGPRRLVCAGCGVESALEALRYAPDAAFASLAVVFADVEDIAVDPELRRAIEAVLGPTKVVLRRPA